MFIRRDEVGNLRLILAYVNEFMFSASCKQRLDMEVSQVQSKFDEKEEHLNWYLCVHIVMRNGRLELSQTAYINEILASFGLTNCQTYATAMTSIFFHKLAVHKDNKTVIDNSYQNMIGFLQSLTHQSRPHIARAVGILFLCTAPNQPYFSIKVSNEYLGT